MNSYWINSTKKEEGFSKINKDYDADVCIIGAGITGLSTAYYLTKDNYKVIIVDKATSIGEKASGNTTAKITVQHNLIYDYLVSSFNEEYALKYFGANKNAINEIKNIIDSEKIDCDFSWQNNYVYTTNKNEADKIQREVNVVNKLNKLLEATPDGIENGENYAQFITKCDLPFDIAGAIETKKQAQFHPRKYMQGLAKAIMSRGGIIFTNSLVSDVNKVKDGYEVTCNEYHIKSKYVVLASHYPFINFPGFYFSKMYQVTSYAMCIETQNQIPEGMYISAEEPSFSVRSVKIDGKKALILAGGNHKTGYSPDSDVNYGYAYLERKVNELYPKSNILYKWNTRDCISLDKVPYIGEFSSFMPNVFVATGYNKWGMTSSNIAANIIADKIMKKSNQYEDVFNASRFSPIKNREEIKNMADQTIKSFISNKLKIPEADISAIENENGGIIKVNGKSVGIYKDKNGKVYAVKPTCTHLGCLLTWNNVDKTWDCPCHGSRFDYTGKNLYDPAFEDLEQYLT